MCAVTLLFGAQKAHHHLPFIPLCRVYLLHTRQDTNRSSRVNKLSKQKRKNQLNPSPGLRLVEGSVLLTVLTAVKTVPVTSQGTPDTVTRVPAHRDSEGKGEKGGGSTGVVTVNHKF